MAAFDKSEGVVKHKGVPSSARRVVRQPLSNFEMSSTQRLSPSSVGPFGLFLSMLIYFFVCGQAGRCLPLVSSPKGTSASPTRKTRADIATGIPIV